MVPRTRLANAVALNSASFNLGRLLGPAVAGLTIAAVGSGPAMLANAATFAAIENSRKDQTYNTPAIATLVMLDEQVRWLLGQGGLAWADERTRESSGLIHAWVERRPEASFFVIDPHHRSQVVTTIDLDPSVDAGEVIATLRTYGIVDIEPYRKLGRNQLRIATFTAVEPSDVQKLLACLDALIEQL